MSERQFMNKSMKDWDPSDGHDLTPKARIQRILRGMGIYTTITDTLFIDKQDGSYRTTQPKASSKEEIFRKYYVRNPDILSIKSKLIVELDGTFHRESGKGVKQTRARDSEYSTTDLKCLSIITEDLKDMSDMDIRKLILDLY